MITYKTEKILCILGIIVIGTVIAASFFIDGGKLLSNEAFTSKLFTTSLTYMLWIWAIGRCHRRLKKQIKELCYDNKDSLGTVFQNKKMLNEVADACCTFKGKKKKKALAQLNELRNKYCNTSERIVITYILYVFYQQLSDNQTADREWNLITNLSPYFAESVEAKYTFQ